jgi:hypothetical protein
MNETTDSVDVRLIEAMTVLDATVVQVARMGRVVDATLERLKQPLWLEWLVAFRARPLRSAGLILAAATVLLLTTPLGSILSAVLNGVVRS